MHTQTAYERRETLSDNELQRLKVALQGEVDRYLDAIQNYSADNMQRHGRPHLEKLEARVVEIDRVQKARS